MSTAVTTSSTATTGSTGEYYLLKRDEAESKRLDNQHNFLIEICGGKLIHKSIHEDQVFSVADVATGTGIWLRNLQKHLDTTYPTDKKRYYHGFDISDEQFPADRNNGAIQYSLHDCLKPFPAEHHNRYDLVHVRLLVAALKEPEYKQAVENLTALLKPGGYLQWEDLDLLSYLTTPETKYQSFPSMDTLRMCINAQIGFGASQSTPASVAAAAEAAGMKNIVRIDYRTKDKPELAATTQAWINQVLETLIGVIIRRMNQTATASAEADGTTSQQQTLNVDEEVRKRMQEVENGYNQGLVMHGNVGMVVARKS